MKEQEYNKIFEGGRALESRMIEQGQEIMTTVVTLVRSNHVVGQFRLDEGDGKDVEYYLNPEQKPLQEPLSRGRIGLMRIDQAQQRVLDHSHQGGK